MSRTSHGTPGRAPDDPGLRRVAVAHGRSSRRRGCSRSRRRGRWTSSARRRSAPTSGWSSAHVSKVSSACLDPGNDPGLRRARLLGAICLAEGWHRGTRFGSIGDGPDELQQVGAGPQRSLRNYQPAEAGLPGYPELDPRPERKRAPRLRLACMSQHAALEHYPTKHPAATCPHRHGAAAAVVRNSPRPRRINSGGCCRRCAVSSTATDVLS